MTLKGDKNNVIIMFIVTLVGIVTAHVAGLQHLDRVIDRAVFWIGDAVFLTIYGICSYISLRDAGVGDNAPIAGVWITFIIIIGWILIWLLQNPN